MHQNVYWLRIQDMENDYQKLFRGLGSPSVPTGLFDSVLLRIDDEVRRSSRLKFVVFVSLVFVSSVGVIVSFQYLLRDILQSGLLQYFSILFSDGGAVLSYWKEFLLSLVEQAPLFGIAIFSGALLALLESLRIMVKNMQTMFVSV